MNLMQTLQDLISQNASPGTSGRKGTDNPILDSLSGVVANSTNLIGPAAIGGLLGALLTSRAARGVAGGALLAGGGAMLWNKLKDRIAEANAGNPQYAKPPSSNDERAARLIRALVFAAKSDGVVDDTERAAILREVAKLDIGADAERLIQEALGEPLDPEALAREAKTPEEALELYTVSCAAVTPDQFMERSYLSALAKALNIPDDVKKAIEEKTQAPA